MTTENKMIFYVSLFIPVFMSSHRLTNFLSDKGFIVGIPWQFNAAELTYQAIFQFVFCFVFGYVKLNMASITKEDSIQDKFKKHLMMFLLFILFLAVAGVSQRIIFDNVLQIEQYRIAYIIRFTLSAGLMLILAKFLSLNREKRAKELENEMLKSAYYNAQLKSLRAQVNPHFLFNSFSSLSSLIAENVELAQKYVSNLAKVFRYSLADNSSQLVALEKEIALIEANAELLKIRYEDALQVHINKKGMDALKVPFMSLQPLLENVTKHNHISEGHPIRISIYIQNEQLYFVNNLTRTKYDSPSTGIGLFNLNERYKLLLDREIEINRTTKEFKVILPLVAN